MPEPRCRHGALTLPRCVKCETEALDAARRDALEEAFKACKAVMYSLLYEDEGGD